MLGYGFNPFGPLLPFVIEVEKQTEDYSVTTFGVLSEWIHSREIAHDLSRGSKFGQTPPYLSKTPLDQAKG